MHRVLGSAVGIGEFDFSEWRRRGRNRSLSCGREIVKEYCTVLWGPMLNSSFDGILRPCLCLPLPPRPHNVGSESGCIHLPSRLETAGLSLRSEQLSATVSESVHNLLYAAIDWTHLGSRLQRREL